MFGLWSACASVGNILGAFLASMVLKHGYEVSPPQPHSPWRHLVSVCGRKVTVRLVVVAVRLPGDLPGAVRWRGGGVFWPADLPKGSRLVGTGVRGGRSQWDA